MEYDIQVGITSALLSEPTFDDFCMAMIALGSAMKSASQTVDSGGLKDNVIKRHANDFSNTPTQDVLHAGTHKEYGTIEA